MKRGSILPLWLAAMFLVLLSAIGAGVVYLRLHPAPGADVQFEPSLVKIGAARQGEHLEREVSLHNRLDLPVRIVALHSTCNCTNLPEAALGAVVAPGERLKFPLTLRTGLADGLVSGTATAYFRVGDAADTFAAAVQIAAQVLPDYRLEPEIVDFGAVHDRQPVVRQLILRPAGDPAARITSARSSHREFTVSLAAEPGAKAEGRALTIQFTPPAEPTSQYFSGVLTLETTSSRAPTYKALVRARYEPPVEASPSALVISAAAGAGPPQAVRIRSRRPCRIDALVYDAEHFAVTAAGGSASQTSHPSSEHILEVQLLDRSRAADIHGSLTVRLASPVGVENGWSQELVLPIHVLVFKGE